MSWSRTRASMPLRSAAWARGLSSEVSSPVSLGSTSRSRKVSPRVIRYRLISLRAFSNGRSLPMLAPRPVGVGCGAGEPAWAWTPSVRALVQPGLVGGEAERSPQELLHQLGGGHGAPGSQHGVAIAPRHRRVEQVRLVELGEQVLGDHLGPHVGVIARRVAIEVSERALEVRARDVGIGEVLLVELPDQRIGVDL